MGADSWECNISTPHCPRTSVFLFVQKHPSDKQYWGVNHGQAPIDMKKHKTKSTALKLAIKFMKKHPTGQIKGQYSI